MPTFSEPVRQQPNEQYELCIACALPMFAAIVVHRFSAKQSKKK